MDDHLKKLENESIYIFRQVSKNICFSDILVWSIWIKGSSSCLFFWSYSDSFDSNCGCFHFSWGIFKISKNWEKRCSHNFYWSPMSKFSYRANFFYLVWLTSNGCIWCILLFSNITYSCSIFTFKANKVIQTTLKTIYKNNKNYTFTNNMYIMMMSSDKNSQINTKKFDLN